MKYRVAPAKPCDVTALQGRFALKSLAGARSLRLSPELVREINGQCRHSTYRRGTILCEEGRPAEAVHILCSGRVALCSASARGETRTLHMVDPGEAIGICCVFVGIAYPFSAEVLEDSHIASIPLGRFLDFCSKCPDAMSWFAAQLSHELIEAFRHITIVLEPQMDRRLLSLIVLWAAIHGKQCPEGVAIGASQREFSEAVGASRETVNRLFSRFKKRGLIRVEAGRVIVPSMGRLQNLLSPAHFPRTGIALV